jgi:ABC-2 type transport system permease protein
MTTIAPVRVAARGPAHELRAVSVVWRRELYRFRTDRGRILSSFAQPLLFLFVLGKGLGANIPRGSFSGADYSTFLFPGVLATSVMFTAVFSAISIVWDRELGFLREMLVAPVSRSSIVLG